MTWNAAVVLRLEDGSEVTRRRLPDGVSACQEQIDDHQGSNPRVTVAPVAALSCTGEEDTVRRQVLVEAATAELVAPPEDPDQGDTGCGTSAYSVPPPGEPVVVRWSGDNPRCSRPEIFTVEPSPIRLEPLTSIRPPDDLPPPTEDPHPQLDVRQIFSVGDLTVLALRWETDDVFQHDLVAVDPTGAIRWRVPGPPVDADDIATPESLLHLRRVSVTATDAGVVALWGGDWHLLSVNDGTEQRREPALPGELTEPVAGDEHIYTFPEAGGLVVRSTNDLSVLATSDDFDITMHRDLPPDFRSQLMLAAGRLVVHDPQHETLTGYTGSTPAGEITQRTGARNPARHLSARSLGRQSVIL